MELLKFKPKKDPLHPWANPIEVLKELIKDIEEGRTKPENLFILFWENNEDGSKYPRRWVYKTDGYSAITLLELAKTLELEELRGLG